MSSTVSTKFKGYNSPEYQIIKDVFTSIPMMDVYVANVVEEYIYSIVREYYPSNDSLMCEYRTKYGEKDGEYKEWNRGADNSDEGRGQLLCQMFYVEDKEHGEMKLWFMNGQLVCKTTYIKGKLQEEYREWFNRI